MRSILIFISCLLAFSLPSAAQQYTFLSTDIGAPVVDLDFNGITDDGLVDGLTASMSIFLSSYEENGAGDNDFIFSVTVGNTSTAPVTSTISAAGFDLDPNATDLALSADGTYFVSVDPDGHFPVLPINLDVCVTGANGNCTGGGGGVTAGNDDTFFLMVSLADGQTSVTLDNFRVRYQAIQIDGEGDGSGIGLVTVIPEPATWLMMIIGFALVSAAARRTRRHSSAIARTC